MTLRAARESRDVIGELLQGEELPMISAGTEFSRNMGGEALRHSSGDMPEHLKGIGVPTVVVALLDLKGRECPHHFFPSLSNVFLGAFMGFGDACADVLYRLPIPPAQIENILQPGSAEYGRLGPLPTKMP